MTYTDEENARIADAARGVGGLEAERDRLRRETGQVWNALCAAQARLMGAVEDGR